jgi:hypothetical protein
MSDSDRPVLSEDKFFRTPKWREAQQVIYDLTDDDGAIDVPAVIQGLWELWGLAESDLDPSQAASPRP